MTTKTAILKMIILLWQHIAYCQRAPKY